MSNRVFFPHAAINQVIVILLTTKTMNSNIQNCKCFQGVFLKI